MLSDLYQYYGDDLSTNATGDLLAASSIERSQQRVVRRLLTNPRDYIWHPDYGAGLPGYIGLAVTTDIITSVIKSQIFKEASVLRTPEPIVQITPITSGFNVVIQYTESDSNESSYLNFNVTNEPGISNQQ